MTSEGMKTHYETLDIPSDATPDQIRKAFRSLAFIYHPDLATQEGMPPDAFVQIRLAYEVLSDEERRRSYDREIAAIRQAEAQRKQEAAARVVNVERPKARQYYSPLFSEQRLARPLDAELLPPDQTILRRPCDISGSIEIALEETLHPTIFSIVLPETTGAAVQGKIAVRLPGKIHRDAILRIPRCGLFDGNERGDLIIEVVIAQHQDFRICADSLFYDLNVAPWQAALGFEAVIPTLEGFEKLPIPPLMSTPTMRRLAGKGIYRKNGERGDLWVNLKLEVPPPTTFRARRLWAELAEEYRHIQRASDKGTN